MPKLCRCGDSDNRPPSTLPVDFAASVISQADRYRLGITKLQGQRHRGEISSATGGSGLPPVTCSKEPVLTSALLAAALLAATSLFLMLAPLMFTVLSLAILLLAALLSRTTRFARFVWILLCVHGAFLCYSTSYSCRSHFATGPLIKSAWKLIRTETRNQVSGWLPYRAKPYWMRHHVTWLRHAVVCGQLLAASRRLLIRSWATLISAN
jgi:hypothetical protein